jgi:hypothetical protein
MGAFGYAASMTDANQVSAAEQRLAAAGIPLEEEDFGREDEPDVGGCTLAEPVAGGTRVKAVIRPGLAGEPRAMLAEWAESRFQRFTEHGPEPDGWQKRTSDGAWQLWARLHEMPSPDCVLGGRRGSAAAGAG